MSGLVKWLDAEDRIDPTTQERPRVHQGSPQEPAQISARGLSTPTAYESHLRVLGFALYFLTLGLELRISCGAGLVPSPFELAPRTVQPRLIIELSLPQEACGTELGRHRSKFRA